MADDKSFSLVNLGDLSKPANTLIEKISDAVGGIFAPYQTRRMARADADAALTKAEAEIEVTDLHRRAIRRFFEEEAQRQKNMEDITAQALPQLKESADPGAVENDWITNFFDRARVVSDDEMQDLWSRVLAGEANSPGTYSRRTVNILSDLDNRDAELFTTLCRFSCVIDGYNLPLVFDPHAETYSKHRIHFSSLSHLDSIGLLRFDPLVGFWRKVPERFVAQYYEHLLDIEMQPGSNNQLDVGTIMLTHVGQELARIALSTSIDGFVDHIKEKWKTHILAVRHS